MLYAAFLFFSLFVQVYKVKIVSSASPVRMGGSPSLWMSWSVLRILCVCPFGRLSPSGSRGCRRPLGLRASSDLLKFQFRFPSGLLHSFSVSRCPPRSRAGVTAPSLFFGSLCTAVRLSGQLCRLASLRAPSSSLPGSRLLMSRSLAVGLRGFSSRGFTPYRNS